MPKIRPTDLPTTFQQGFALRLQQLRVDHGKRSNCRMSQMTFAALLGIDMNRYGSYERADREPPLEILARLRQVTGVSLDKLIGADLAIPVKTGSRRSVSLSA